jgi:hypothetical protein
VNTAPGDKDRKKLNNIETSKRRFATSLKIGTSASSSITLKTTASWCQLNKTLFFFVTDDVAK